MYAPHVQRNVINYRDLNARKYSRLYNNVKVFNFRQRPKVIAIAKVSSDGFYKVVIKPLAFSPILDAEDVCMAA